MTLLSSLTCYTACLEIWSHLDADFSNPVSEIIEHIEMCSKLSDSGLLVRILTVVVGEDAAVLISKNMLTAKHQHK